MFGGTGAPIPARAQVMFGADSTTGTLYALDPVTGAVITTIGDTGLGRLTALASHPITHVLYGLFGTRGLMVLNASGSPPSVSAFIKAAPGKVLAVAPDGNHVIVSDTADTPKQVFVVDTSSNTTVSLQIAGATAADFSPDSLKAYILAGDTLHVYSALESLKSIALSAAARDVSFLSNGGFAYLAGGDPAGVSARAVCLAGDDEVRHVMSDGVSRAELLGGAPDRLDPLEGSHSHGAHVVDDVRREDLPEPVQVASVE